VLEVNLLPEQEKVKAGYHARVVLAGGVSSMLVLAVLGAAGILHWRTNVRERELQLLVHDIADAERAMVQNASSLEQALAFQQRSRAVKSLLATHTHWSSFLAFLEEMTSPHVYYDGFLGERNGAITLKAHARDFGTAAEQLVTFLHDPRVTKVSLSPVAAGEVPQGREAEVVFDITLSVDPRVITPRLPTAPSVSPNSKQ
jgi:Tfp pilus assembly protein PilN